MLNSAAEARIITFYSYKGGTGRSMALANVAWILASNGKRVLVIDWDLEAPGLHRYFHPFLQDEDLSNTDGLMDFIINFADIAVTPLDPSEKLDANWYIPHANIMRYAMSLDWDFPAGGTLDFVPAGRQSPSYSSQMASFSWKNFYDRLGGGAFLEAMKKRARSEYDYILIDSRTGISDISGICTIQMPDIIVACFRLNRQSMEGTAKVMTDVASQRSASGLRIYPVPMSVEIAEREKLARVTHAAKRIFSPFLHFISPLDPDVYWSEVQFLYSPFYAYEELLATFAEGDFGPVSILSSAERLTAFLTDGEVTRMPSLPHDQRLRVLAQYDNPHPLDQ